MGFFATFWSWLNTQLTGFIGDNTARLAALLEPAVVTLATLYVMAWGYLHLAGKLDEPLLTGLKRIAIIALVLGVGLRLWLYNSVLVDTFYTAPAQLASGLVGASDPVGAIDAIWDSGGTVAGTLWNKGGVLSGDVGFYIAGAVVWFLMGVLCVYVMFLIALSSVALAILLALGPLFVAMLLFDTTRRLFAAWMAQLTHYALVTLLTVVVAALLLHLVESYAQQTAARGAAILTVDALNMVLVAALVFLVLRQIMPIAASLSGGVALVTTGVASRNASRALALAGRAGAPALAYALPHVARGVGSVGRRASAATSYVADTGRRRRRGTGAQLAQPFPLTVSSPRRVNLEILDPVRPAGGLLVARRALRRPSRAHQRAGAQDGRQCCGRTLMAASDAGLEAYFAAAQAWDGDRRAQEARGARLAWWSAGAGWSCALGASVALCLLMPLKRVDPFVIRVDNSTGIVDVVPVYAGNAPLEPSITRYFLTHYVDVCERFYFATAESDYEECGAFHSAQRNQAWYAQWAPSNPASPLNVHKDGSSQRAEVTSVSFFTGGSGLSDLAQVRYLRAARQAAGGEERITHWLATVRFAYAAPSTDPRVRRWNPLGFRVVEFRSEPELIAENKGSSE